MGENILVTKKEMPIITTPIDVALQSAITTNTANSFGNQTLYDMCKRGSMLSAYELADEIWLIGRSYAASPERRFANRVGSLTRGRGTGDYFKHIASYLVTQPAFLNLVKKIKSLTPLKFDSSAPDFNNLCLSVQCVEELNELIIVASKKYDSVYNPGILCPPTVYKNQISFCSKFLHFQAPENFFIIDTFTYAAGKQLFSTSCKGAVNLYSVPITCVERYGFSNELSHAFASATKCPSSSPIIDEYKNHVKRSYALGVILKEIEKMYSVLKSPLVTYPRLTDIIFQNV